MLKPLLRISPYGQRDKAQSCEFKRASRLACGVLRRSTTLVISEKSIDLDFSLIEELRCSPDKTPNKR
jgi:hypothetical protein